MPFAETIFSQFGHPRGVLGRLAGTIMATRPSNRARNEWTIDLLDISPYDRVLDFGCGPGVAVALAATQASHVTGIDHSDLMCRQARRRNRTAIAEGRVEIIAGGLEVLGALHGQIDKLCTLNVIMFLPDKAAAFASFRDALKPGGTIAVTHMPRNKGADTDDTLAAAERIVRWMTTAGFLDVVVHRLPLKPVEAVSVLGRRGN